jgi:hypothetical protein
MYSRKYTCFTGAHCLQREGTTETLAYFNETTWRYIPEGCKHQDWDWCRMGSKGELLWIQSTFRWVHKAREFLDSLIITIL